MIKKIRIKLGVVYNNWGFFRTAYVAEIIAFVFGSSFLGKAIHAKPAKVLVNQMVQLANVGESEGFDLKFAKAHRNRILPPDSPHQDPPKGVTDDQAMQDIERLRQRRKEREAKNPKRQTPLAKDRTKQLDEVAKNPGPMRLLLKASLAYTKFITSDSKMKNYNSDPSVFFHAYIKPNEIQDHKSFELWTGFRLLPLSGSGIYNNTAGRFGFTYFGPMIGLGRISPATYSLGAFEESLGADERSKDYNRDALFWMSGIALVSRSGFVEWGREKPEDFSSSGVAIDAPGIWTELTIATIYYSTVSQGMSIGIQMGKGKNLLYLSYDLGFWY